MVGGQGAGWGIQDPWPRRAHLGLTRGLRQRFLLLNRPEVNLAESTATSPSREGADRKPPAGDKAEPPGEADVSACLDPLCSGERPRPSQAYPGGSRGATLSREAPGVPWGPGPSHPCQEGLPWSPSHP